VLKGEKREIVRKMKEDCRGVYLIRVQVQGRVQDKKLRI
jgi:hypothetical protein